MFSKNQFTPEEISTMCASALNNWDRNEMSANEIRTLEYYRDNPQNLGTLEVTEQLQRSFGDEWDWLAELAIATSWN